MKHCFTIFLLCNSVFVWAQSEKPLGGDRPGQGTDAASVLGVKNVQLEVGLFYEQDDEVDYSLLKYPVALLRYGIIDRVEIRVSSELFTNPSTNGTLWAPISLGTKVALVEEQRGWVPQAALLVSLTLPQTGSPSTQSRFTQPHIVLLLNHSLTAWLGITTNLGAHWENDSPETIYRYAMSFDFSLSDRVGAFAEFYGDLPEVNPINHQFNSGFTFLVNNDLQFDLAVGTALTEGAPDYYLGGGMALRW